MIESSSKGIGVVRAKIEEFVIVLLGQAQGKLLRMTIRGTNL